MSDATLPPGRGREHDNSATMIMRVVPRDDERSSFRELFVRHYPAIRRAGTGFPHPGVVIVAAEDRRHREPTVLCVAARPDAPSVAIVGRHSQADLFLPHDPTLSLRHLAVLVGTAAEDQTPRLRIMDLRTPLGFEDEHGHPCRSLAVDGPVLLRCSRQALFFLVTGTDTEWPENAYDAWAQLPPREYPEPDDDPQAPWPPAYRVADTMVGRSRRTRSTSDSTIVHRVAGPVTAKQRLLIPDEEPRGSLVLGSSERPRRLIVGDRALRRGVLLGRYDRCESGGGMRILDPDVSRVHLLVLAIDDRPHAIDTASTNGSYVREEARRIRIVPVDASGELVLARGPTTVRWQPG